MKPMAVLQSLAKQLGYYWDIDDQRNIHFFEESTTNAPFNLTETSSNFKKLSIGIDISQLKNVQYVEGGEDISESFYAQAEKGNNAIREFVLKSKFANLSAWLDDGTDTNAAEAGTTTTNIKITAHGLETGDYITNRTRDNTVREISKVDDDNFTVEAIASQTSGDNITFFSDEQTTGIEGIIEESTVDYVYNSNAKRIRASEQTTTLTDEEFLMFRYKERFPIITAAQNGASVGAMQSKLGYSNGQVVGGIIRNKDIKSQEEAKKLAQAHVTQYGNAIFTATFRTHVYGLRAGQLINITDSTFGRDINQAFMIQKASAKTVAGEYFLYKVSASSALYGIVEFFQQLLRASLLIEFDESAIPINLVQGAEEIVVSDIFTQKSNNTQAETVTVTDVNSRLEPRTPPYQWGPTANVLEWSLGQWA